MIIAFGKHQGMDMWICVNKDGGMATTISVMNDAKITQTLPLIYYSKESAVFAKNQLNSMKEYKDNPFKILKIGLIMPRLTKKLFESLSND